MKNPPIWPQGTPAALRNEADYLRTEADIKRLTRPAEAKRLRWMRKVMLDAADRMELLMQQRDALAEVAGIEPEWTEADA